MTAQVSVFSKAVERSCKGEILENSHTFKIMALTSSYTPALDTDDVKADIVANEATGTNWSAGGATLGSVTLTRTIADSWPTARANSTAYALGDIVRPATGNGHLYRCVAAGTSHSSIPTYPTTPGKTVVETGGVEWAECGTAGIVFDAADVSVATVTMTARYFVIYDDTHASDALFLLYDPGASVAPVAGTLTIPWPTNGIFVRTTTEGAIMLVAYRKSTGQVIPDFQSSAKAETLISNAVRHGIAEEDIEVRDMTEAEARAAAEAHFAAARLAAEAEAEARRLAAIAVAKKLGLTRAEVLALRDLLSE